MIKAKNKNEKDSVDEKLDETIKEDLESLDIGKIEAASDSDLEEPYEKVGILNIPEEAKQAYLEKGWDLQFIRIYQPNTDNLDLKNIQRKEQEGYQFVKREEIPGLGTAMTSYFGDIVSDNHHGLYIVGELALAKYSLANKDKKKKYLQEKTQARSRAVLNDLRKNNAMPSEGRNEGWEISREQPKGTS